MKINLKKALRKISSVAPTLVKLAFGSRGEAVIETVKSVLGVDQDASEEAVAKVIENATPEQLAKLKEMDFMFAKLDQETQGMFLSDTQSARTLAIEKGTTKQFILTCVIIIGYVALCIGFGLALVTPNLVVNPDLMALFSFVFGGITIAFAQTMNFWFGTTKGSARKTDQMFELQVRNGKK